MKRVYLAKSNRANPNLVSEVRQTLSKFDIQVVEYTGGNYSNESLLSCDELIIVPDLSTCEHDYDNYFTTIKIGKGLYEQISVFKNAGKFPITYIIDYDTMSDCDDSISVINEKDCDYIDINVVDERNYQEYATVVFEILDEYDAYADIIVPFNHLLNKRFKVKDNRWVTNTLTESVNELKTWKSKTDRKKFMILLSKN